MNRETERRYTRGLVEVRADSRRTIGGYAAKFNRLSQNLGGFVERIDPAFFNKSAGDGWPGVLARYNHDDNMLLGTTAAGTLRLRLDETGLDYTVDLPEHRGDVLELIARGDVRQSSFAFRTLDDDWSVTEQGFPLRTLLSGQLVDVAPVNSPAYLDTSTGLRSLAERTGAEVAEVERLAREGELRKLLGGPAPTVIDLGGGQHAAPVEQPSDGPAAVADAPNGAAERSANDHEYETSASAGQGDTHPVLAVRLRHAELTKRRISPLEQGATHSAPVPDRQGAEK